MSETDKLQQAYQLIRSGEKTEAVKLLLPIVRADPDNADAWWLLANAVEKSDQAKRALQQVLKVRPNDQRARRFLEQLGGTPPSTRTPSPPTTFDEDVLFTTSGAPAVYEDDPFDDDLPPIEDDVWEDPFALDDSDESDAAFRPPGASRPVDPDLNFDEDPFAPDKPVVPPPAPPAKRQSNSQTSRQPANARQPAKRQGRSQTSRQPANARQPARGGGARRQGGGQRRPAKPIALPGVEEFAEDPFAPDSVLKPRRSIGELLIAGLLLALLLLALIAFAVFSIVNNVAGSTHFSVIVTMDGSGILGDLPLESLALTALVDPRAVEGALGTAVADLETMATIMAQITALPGFIGGGAGIPADARKLGRIEIGQSVSETVDTFTDDSWTFGGTAGQMIVIELDSLDSTLDPQLYLYTTAAELLAENDDISMVDNNLNARIEFTLPANGDYIIIVSAFGEGGAYELRLLPG